MITEPGKIKAVFVWSGGKDSAMALYRILQNPSYQITYLLTTVNKQFNRVSMHGVRTTLLEQQAESLQLPLLQVQLPENPSMEEYTVLMTEAFTQLKKSGIRAAVFGDIFLQDLRAYREQQMEQIGLKAVFPLWNQDTTLLINDFISLNFKAVLVCLNAKYFPETFAGREIDETFLADLPTGVDPCGENGEYHSFVYNGPIFKNPINFEIGETVFRNYGATANSAAENPGSPSYDNAFWFLDLK